jgi:hypothetical protein
MSEKNKGYKHLHRINWEAITLSFSVMSKFVIRMLIGDPSKTVIPYRPGEVPVELPNKPVKGVFFSEDEKKRIQDDAIHDRDLKI